MRRRRAMARFLLLTMQAASAETSVNRPLQGLPKILKMYVTSCEPLSCSSLCNSHIFLRIFSMTWPHLMMNKWRLCINIDKPTILTNLPSLLLTNWWFKWVTAIATWPPLTVLTYLYLQVQKTVGGYDVQQLWLTWKARLQLVTGNVKAAKRTIRSLLALDMTSSQVQLG